MTRLTAQEIKAVLSQEKRKQERLRVPVRVSFRPHKTAQPFKPARVLDMSGGGMRVKSPVSLTKNTKLDISLTVPENLQPLPAQGKVSWCKPISAKTKTYAIGITFMRMAPENRRLFVQCMSEYILRAYLL